MSTTDEREATEAAEAAGRLFATVLLTSIARDPNRLRWALATIDTLRAAVCAAAAAVAVEPGETRH